MSVEQDVRIWLRQRGAETIDHPGGTLYAHLSRVHARLSTLGLDTDVRLAGLVHAAYGTDGFEVVLLDPSDRTELRLLIGPAAEALVYRYGACDRHMTWRDLAKTRTVWNRFVNEAEPLSATQLRQFVDLSIVNELDVVEQDPMVAEKYGAYFRTLFSSWADIASAQVTSEARRLLSIAKNVQG